jgi:hypothetical protein
MIYIVPKN